MKKIIQSHFNEDFKKFYEKFFHGIKEQSFNSEFKAICPFHRDSSPSFSFSNETGQFYCHGCKAKGDIFDFYAKIKNPDSKKDFKQILNGIAEEFGIPWKEQKGTIVKTYDYKNEQGKLLFQVCRFEPKDFRQRQPDGKGGWIWNLKDIEPVLYRLPEICKVQEVLVVEGEKDVESVMGLGFTATTSPMGARKWKDDYNAYLEGKDIVLIPDNDNEGREHMVQVAVSLNGTAKTLKWIELPNLPIKGDVSDWIATFKEKKEAAESLAVMIERADIYEPPKMPALEDAILQVEDFCILTLPPKKKILTPWISEQSIILISGWRGTGKTWFALSIVDAITKREPFGPWETVNSVPCLFLDGEMPAQDIQERMSILNNYSDRESPLYIYSDAFANSLGLPRAHLANETWRAKMKEILINKGVKLWVIDNLASLASGLDENVKKDWDPINSSFLDLRFAGISTIVLHHVNKEGGQRGTSAREDNIDISIMLKSPSDYTPEDGARFIAHFTKARVSTKDLKLIADNEFKLIQDDSGRLVWTWENAAKKKNKREILRMLDKGVDYSTIVKTLGISKSLISKVKKQAIEVGLLTPEGKLTEWDAYMSLDYRKRPKEVNGRGERQSKRLP